MLGLLPHKWVLWGHRGGPHSGQLSEGMELFTHLDWGDGHAGMCMCQDSREHSLHTCALCCVSAAGGSQQGHNQAVLDLSGFPGSLTEEGGRSWELPGLASAASLSTADPDRWQHQLPLEAPPLSFTISTQRVGTLPHPRSVLPAYLCHENTTFQTAGTVLSALRH